MKMSTVVLLSVAVIVAIVINAVWSISMMKLLVALVVVLLFGLGVLELRSRTRAHRQVRRDNAMILREDETSSED